MYCNIAAYKFTTLEKIKLPEIREGLKKLAQNHSLKGTILLGTEGINLFLAGNELDIKNFEQTLSTHYPLLGNLPYKYSYSNKIPFKKLSVKIRDEIVTFQQEHIQPEKFTAPYISANTLKNWLKEGRNITLLDTRNTFEYEIGSFEQAVHLNITNFREFPDGLANDSGLDKNKPLITFCTGGIRCEKAAAYLLKEGFTEVYQLEGGILNYFEQCEGDYFRGNCFVFDDRMVLNKKLEPLTDIE